MIFLDLSMEVIHVIRWAHILVSAVPVSGDVTVSDTVQGHAHHHTTKEKDARTVGEIGGRVKFYLPCSIFLLACY